MYTAGGSAGVLTMTEYQDKHSCIRFMTELKCVSSPVCMALPAEQGVMNDSETLRCQ